MADDTSDAEVERQERESDRETAAHRLGRATRELAANVLRIAAGTGKPDSLILQAAALVEASAELDRLDHRLGQDTYARTVTEALRDHSADFWSDHPRFTDEEVQRWHESGEMAVGESRAAIIREAMRVCAAELVWQRTQKSNALSELDRAVDRYSEAREQRSKAIRKKRK
jgi:hypothetical protein